MSIYHYHIRKTGGTTINFSFINVLPEDNTKVKQMVNARGVYKSENGKKIVGHNSFLLKKEDYFYGFSHIPFQNIGNLKDSTVKLTCFRDPVDRVISHYNMLMNMKKSGSRHPCMSSEGPWVKDGTLSGFINKIPPQHLTNQLFMFSTSFNLNEAIDNISKLKYILFTETLNDDLKNMFNDLNLPLKEIFHKKEQTYDDLDIKEEEKDKLKEMLYPEYLLLEKIKNELL